MGLRTVGLTLCAIVLALAAGCASNSRRNSFITKAEGYENYGEVSLVAKGAAKTGKKNSIDYHAQYGRTEQERQGMPNLKTGFWKVNAGTNQAFKIGDKTFIIPGIDLTLRDVDYNGGNAPNHKYSFLPGARLRLKSETVNAYVRHREAVAGEYEIPNGDKLPYRETNTFAEANVNLGKDWKVGAEFEQWRKRYMHTGTEDTRNAAAYVSKKLETPVTDDIAVGVTATDTNYNPGKNYRTAFGTAVKINKKLTDSLELELGGQYWPTSDKYNTPGSGGWALLKFIF